MDDTAAVSPDPMDLLSTPELRERFEQKSAALEAADFVRQMRRQALSVTGVRGISQDELAQRTGLSQPRISQIEKGSGRDGISYALLRRIAYACGIDWGASLRAAIAGEAISQKQVDQRDSSTDPKDLLNPPSVEGWHTGREWINSGSLMARINFVAEQVGIDTAHAVLRTNVAALLSDSGYAAPGSVATAATDAVAIANPGMGRIANPGMGRLSDKSHSVTAEIEVPESGAEGVIIAEGANIGGWSLYAKAGKLKYYCNLGMQHFHVEAASKLPAGEHQVRMEFAYAGSRLRKGGKVMLYVDGEQVGEGNIPMTLADVGEDSGAPVSPDYGPRGNAFNGRVKGVEVAIADAAESSDHLVSPEEALRIAMARQ